MAILNLSKFPNVCRLCLQPKKRNETYLTVQKFKTENGLNLLDQLNESFFPVPDVSSCKI